MGRIEADEYFLQMAELVSTRSTCIRRSVGCVLVNRRKHVLATGYNGVPAGAPHCNEKAPKFEPYGSRSLTEYPNACPGAGSPSGEDLEACYAIHAEQNALLQCKDVWDIHTVYLTTSPCVTCVKLFMNTSASRIVAREEYDPVAKRLWYARGKRLGSTKLGWYIVPAT